MVDRYQRRGRSDDVDVYTILNTSEKFSQAFPIFHTASKTVGSPEARPSGEHDKQERGIIGEINHNNRLIALPSRGIALH